MLFHQFNADAAAVNLPSTVSGLALSRLGATAFRCADDSSWGLFTLADNLLHDCPPLRP